MAQQTAQQFARVGTQKRFEGDLPIVRSLHEWSDMAGSEIQKQQRFCADHRIDHRLHEFFTGLVHPMQVLDHHQYRFIVRSGVYEVPNESEESMLASSGILLRFRTRRVMQTQKIQQQRQRLAKIAARAQQVDNTLS